jgi:magnesium transporter|tara:strand:+ start:2092 stop:3507 length:1416 start_codon:yes stop_codon:yes gene_type:complete
MDHNKIKTNFDENLVSTNDANFKSLYGLTPIVEDAILNAINKKNRISLKKLIEPLHPADQADMLERLSNEKLNIFLTILGRSLDPEVLVYLDHNVQEKVFNILGPKVLAKAIPELHSDDAVEILQELEEKDRNVVIKQLPKADRILVEEALSYPEYSAGRLMQREFLAFPGNWTVGQTIDHMRANPQDEEDSFYSIYIVDPAHRLMGVISLSKLLSAKRPVRLNDLMELKPRNVNVETDQEEVALLFQQYGLVNMPVVDNADRLLGVIIVDDIVDVINEEAEEDLQGLTGVSDLSITSSFLETAKGRFSWLILNMFTAVLASSVIGLFQEEIEKLVALAVLMPIVASMGGNAGTQTVTVAVRALATRQLNYSNLQKFVLKETWVGMINGFLFALLSIVLAYLWFGDKEIAIIMGLAMIANLLFAGVLGTLIPLTLEKFKIDPAISSSVFLTTATDVIGFFTFLGLSALVIL